MIPILLLQQKIAKTLRPNLHGMRLLALLLIVISLSGAAAEAIHQITLPRAAGSDWPTYLHDPQRSSASSDTTLSPSNAGQLKLGWAFKTGGPIAASPTVVGSTVYAGSWAGDEFGVDAQ